MIATDDFLYEVHRNPPQWPAMVREREPTGIRPATKGASRDGISAPADFGANNDGGASPDAISAPAAPAVSEGNGVSRDAISTPSRSGPGTDDDELFQLGERIAELAARINAAESRMMTLIADFDRRGGWRDGGFSSCAEWLAWRIGVKLGPARERVRTARALENLPRTADALREGSVSYAKVRALTRVATPASETELLEFARAGSAAKLERTVRMWRKLSRDEELTAEQARHRSRALSVFVDGDGIYVVRGRLEPEAGAVLMRAVEAASDALFRRERDAPDAHSAKAGRRPKEANARPEPKQRRADALGLLAERALAAGFGGGECRESGGDAEAISGGRFRESGGDLGKPAHGSDEPGGDADDAGEVGEAGSPRLADRGAATRGESAGMRGDEPKDAGRTESRVASGTRAERYQVMVHCDAATLAAEGEPGRSDLDGIRVSAETSRRMACDAAVVAMVHAKDGAVLSVGRRTRTIPPHVRRALEERDRGCRFPGCACRFTEAHHVKHWADGGETSLKNTLLLCRRHHRAVHEGQVKVSVNSDGTVLFFTPKGRTLVDAPKLRARADAMEQPVRANSGEQRSDPGLPSVPSLHPDAPSMHERAVLSNGAALYPDSVIPWEIEAAAREAVDESLG